MASLIIGGVVFGIDRIRQAKEKKKEKKQAHNDTRFAELEKDNAQRIANLQQNTCFCERSDWAGEGCPTHGPTPQRNGQADDSARRGSGESARSERASTGARKEPQGWTQAPPKMNDEEVARINDQRRKKGGRYKKLFGSKHEG